LILFAWAPALIIGLALAPQPGQCTALADAKGTTGSCIGIGPIVNKCVQIMENSGLIKVNDVGTTGLTFGISGKDDGRIAGVVPGGAGAQAGLQVGDLIVAINGKPTKPTPGMIAVERTFGVRGEGIDIKVRRGEKELDFNLVRDPQTAPPGPQSGTMLIYVHPMINWKGQFIPCMGAGPAGFAAIEICYKTFGKDGYVKVGELGTTGLQFDLDRADAAIVTSVSPDSASAKAGIRAGDEIVQVNQTPLGESLGGILPELLFGRAGDSFTLTVASGGSTRMVKLTLGKKPKE
jgi:C-terminal processing protease CtpA/Prc